MAKALRWLALLAVAAVLLISSALPAGAMVTSFPSRPTHEDRITITYKPGPSDNMTQVRLLLNMNNTTADDLDITKLHDNATNSYTYDLGVQDPGTTIAYSVIAWNVTVDTGNISVASVVDVLWHSDLQEAKSTAARLHRPMLIMFWSNDDRTNMEIMTKTFNDERVLNLSATFVCLKLRLDDDPGLAFRWNITFEPAFVFLDNTSREVHRVHGNLTADTMLAHMRFALGLGPRPVEKPHPLFADPVRNILIVAFLLLLVLGITALRARWWVRRA